MTGVADNIVDGDTSNVVTISVNKNNTNDDNYKTVIEQTINVTNKNIDENTQPGDVKITFVDGTTKTYTLNSGTITATFFTSFDKGTIKLVELPTNVVTIDVDTFKDFNNMTTITFATGSNLTTINKRAFAYCTSLTSIKLPKLLSSIQDYVFYGCKSLKLVRFENNKGGQATDEIYIGANAFTTNSNISIHLNNVILGKINNSLQSQKIQKELSFALKQNFSVKIRLKWYV